MKKKKQKRKEKKYHRSKGMESQDIYNRSADVASKENQ